MFIFSWWKAQRECIQHSRCRPGWRRSSPEVLRGLGTTGSPPTMINILMLNVFFLMFSFSLSSSFGGGIINNRNAWVGFILNRDIVGGEVGTQRCYQTSRHPEKSSYYWDYWEIGLLLELLRNRPTTGTTEKSTHYWDNWEISLLLGLLRNPHTTVVTGTTEKSTYYWCSHQDIELHILRG